MRSGSLSQSIASAGINQPNTGTRASACRPTLIRPKSVENSDENKIAIATVEVM